MVLLARLAASGDAALRLERLSDFVLNPEGISTTALRQITQWTVRHRLYVERSREEAELRKQEQEQERQQKAVDEEQRIADLIEAREKLTEGWLRSPTWKAELAKWGGVAPAWYDRHPGVETGIPHVMWQSVLFREIVEPLESGVAVPRIAAIDLLLEEFPDHLASDARPVAAKMVTAFFRTLETHRFLHAPARRGKNLGRPIWYRIRKRSVPTAMPDPVPAATRRPMHAPPERSYPRTPTNSNGSARCQGCRYPLDPMYAATGFHPFCGPRSG